MQCRLKSFLLDNSRKTRLIAYMRTAAKDQNYLSLNSNSIVWFAGTDQEKEDPGPLSQPLELLPRNPKRWDSILKCSGRKAQILSNVEVYQGKENALDINNACEHLDLDGKWGLVGDEGQQVITVKGGSHDITVSGPVFSNGTECDIELGTWSDQSTAPLYNIDLSNLYHAQGRKLTVKIARVKGFLFILFGFNSSIKLPRDSKVLFWASLAEFCYWWIKFGLVKTGLIKSVKV